MGLYRLATYRTRSAASTVLVALSLAVGLVAVVGAATGPSAVPPPPNPGTIPEFDVPPTEAEILAAEEATKAAVSGSGPPCTSVEQDLNYPNYWVGPSFEGMPLTVVIRQCGGEPADDLPNRTNMVSYLYGDCTPGESEGCALPIEIQTWPVEERNKGLYPADKLMPPHEDTAIAGFEAMKFDGRLEIFRPNVTIAVFGDDNGQIARVAAALERGPIVLAELSQHGLFFSPRCLDNLHFCVAEPISA